MLEPLILLEFTQKQHKHHVYKIIYNGSPFLKALENLQTN